MANTAFRGKYNRVEKPAATCMLALDESPPSMLSLDAGAALS
jgi:hypothetical protein